MKRIIMALGFLANIYSGKAQLLNFESYPVYNGKDLGLTYTPQASVLKLWSPMAEQAELLLYTDGEKADAQNKVDLVRAKDGVWVATVKGDMKNMHYTFRVLMNDKWMSEVPDPYAKAVGINGKRAVVIDLKTTNPEGWATDKSPVFKNKTDAIIYELHVRDASITANGGITNKGKFLGLTETGTKNTQGLSTGLDHIKELGITHVHLLPVFDYNSVNEANPDSKYNWGYDPLNYNVPEGSYSTNAYDGATRIKEFKQLVQAFHKNGLRVVMDVVYNHTALTETSNFNQLVPGYYYRQTKDGKFSNASACGNETASDRPMFRKFMLESMKYWVKEYHVDGFRVDLMGIHDITTMNMISKELHKIKPDILIYGEGWTAGASPLPEADRAIKANAAKLDRIAVFSDDMRDGIKGSVFEHTDKGFASGKPGVEESIKFGVVASCLHPQVDYTKVNYSKAPYAAQPHHTITYCECHDNHVLWDKLGISAKDATEEQRKEMHKLALSMVLTSQGISFLHAGTEFLRSKKGVENSFESPDAINAINWDLKSQNKEVFDYVKALIKMRKEHPAFRLTKAADVAKLISFSSTTPAGVIVFTIDGKKAGDKWKEIRVYYNGTAEEKNIQLDSKYWMTAIRDNAIVPASNKLVDVKLKAFSCTVLYKENGGK
jgi:pullulanase